MRIRWKLIGRAYIHLPVGLWAAWLLTGEHVALGVMFTLSFLVYEIAEDWRIHDLSYIDIFSFMLGLTIGGLFF